MDFDVLPTTQFESDYDRILRYHVENLHAPRAALVLIESMDELRTLLEENPYISAVSRKATLMQLELREHPVRGYTVVYRIIDKTVYLEHLFHQTQDFEEYV